MRGRKVSRDHFVSGSGGGCPGGLVGSVSVKHCGLLGEYCYNNRNMNKKNNLQDNVDYSVGFWRINTTDMEVTMKMRSF